MSERLRMMVDEHGTTTAHKLALLPRERAELAHEAEMLRAAAHPGVVRLLDADEDRLVLAWVGGRSLATHPVRPLRHLVAVAASVATTLADLHQLGLSHGSIEASHILLGPQGQPLLTSFGSAHRASSAMDPDHQLRCARDVADLGHVIEELLEITGSATGEAETLARRLQNHRPRKAVAALARRAHQAPVNLRMSARALADELALLIPDAHLETPVRVADTGHRRVPSPESPKGPEPPTRGLRSTDPPADEQPATASPEAPNSVDVHDDPFPGHETVPRDGQPIIGGSDRVASDRSGPDRGMVRQVPDRPGSVRHRVRRRLVLLAGAATVVSVSLVLFVTLLTANDTPAASGPDDSARDDSATVDVPAGPTDATSAATGPDHTVPAPPPGQRGIEDAPSAITPATPLAGCPWERSDPMAPIDIDTPLDCPDEPVIEGNVVQVGERRFEVGSTGDVVVVGDWWCRRGPTPALLHPPSGDVFVFDTWAPPGGELQATSVATIHGAVGLEADGDGACDQLVAHTDAGTTVHIPVPPPAAPS